MGHPKVNRCPATAGGHPTIDARRSAGVNSSLAKDINACKHSGMSGLVNAVNRISTPPLDEQTFNKWLEAEDALAFLKTHAESDGFVMHAISQHTYIHGMLVPTSRVNPPNGEDLMSWNCGAESSWGICTTFSDPPIVSIVPPLDHPGSETLHHAEQIVIARHFEGRLGETRYYEVLQKFVHLFELHFLQERKAYCRLDKHGDIDEVICIIDIPSKRDEMGGSIVVFKREMLDLYLVLTDSVIIRTFDFTRYRPPFSHWSNQDVRMTAQADLFYRSHIEHGNASYLRGCEIISPVASKESILKRYVLGGEDENKQYESFIAHDWKNGVVKQISCAPGATANYFTESNLPFELSPVFFRPEVLLKYKSDSDKYRLEDRSIFCRGAWYLKTYDINEAGQVHTYLVYLRDLPYEEQLYWKAYNEKPKASISRRAIKTDFEGCWDVGFDPLDSLRNTLREMHRDRVAWWTLRSEKLIEQMHYPVTSSAGEWAEEILHLDQLIVEGFETKWLRNQAQKLGRPLEQNFRSLKLIEECLVGVETPEDEAKNLVAPLRELHDLRSKVKGHATGAEATAIKQRILQEHGAFKKHFSFLCAECEQSIKGISNTIKVLL